MNFKHSDLLCLLLLNSINLFSGRKLAIDSPLLIDYYHDGVVLEHLLCSQ